MDGEFESVLFLTRECYLYRIPPRTDAEGYRAASWGDMGEPLWQGRMRVMERGDGVPSKATIQLEDASTGELFASAPYAPTKSNPHGGVEAVLDSSRYFVLTVIDVGSGNKAYLGLGFPERSSSFDFNVALQDWAKRQTPAPLALATGVSPHQPPPGRDFSLKAGETLNIKIGGGSSTKKKATTTASTGTGFLLPPPPPPAPRNR